MTPYLAEFAGTTLLMVLGLGVNASAALTGSYARSGGWLMVCLGWGLAVTMAVYAAGSASGAHLNPAVTVAFALNGTLPWEMVPGYVAAQMGGAIVGAFLIWLQFMPHWTATPDAAAKLGVFSTAPAIKNTVANFISEMIGTTVLIMGLFFLGTNTFTDGLNPLIVGLLITSIGFSLGGTTGFAINPARDLGPRIAHALLPIAGKGSSDWSYSWIPVAGPLAGAVVAWVLKGVLLG